MHQPGPWIMLLMLAVAGCGTRGPLALDAARDGVTIADGAVARDGPVVRRDLGRHVYQGRVALGEGTDPRVNMPGWVVAQVGFATAFYESMFAPTETHGECQVGQMQPPPPAVTVFLDAGPVKVTGGLVPISFTYSAVDYYDVDLADHTYSLFEVGKTLQVAGAGSAELPAFSAAIPTPMPLKVVTPSMFERSTVVDASQDYAVTWDPSGADLVRFEIRCGGPNYPEIRAVCESPDDGQILVQAQVLKTMMAVCSYSMAAQVNISRVNRRDVVQGDLGVRVEAWTLLEGNITIK